MFNTFSTIAHIRDCEELCELDVCVFDVKNYSYCICQYIVLYLYQNIILNYGTVNIIYESG